MKSVFLRRRITEKYKAGCCTQTQNNRALYLHKGELRKQNVLSEEIETEYDDNDDEPKQRIRRN